MISNRALAASLILCAALCSGQSSHESSDPNRSEEKNLIARFESFSKLKKKQAEKLASDAGETIAPAFAVYFDAAIRGDRQSVTNIFQRFRSVHKQPSYWNPAVEILLAYEYPGDPKYMEEYGDGIIRSIPPGSIYFGGTDWGRGLVTALCKSQPDGDPFFTITQNQLADNNYMEYLRKMYGNRISIATSNEVQQAFQIYARDAEKRRLQHNLHAGEFLTTNVDGRITVTGQVGVMGVSALIAATIVEHNPERECYIEESLPLDWTHPYLEPHGLIMKIGLGPIVDLPQETIDRDHAFWSDFCQRTVGGWITYDTTVKQVCDWAEAVYISKNLDGFSGNPAFVQDEYSRKAFSKLRSSISESIYEWRSLPENSLSATELPRVTKEAEFALKQAFVYCPSSPEAVAHFATFLMHSSPPRITDAEMVIRIGYTLNPTDPIIAKMMDIAKRMEAIAARVKHHSN